MRTPVLATCALLAATSCAPHTTVTAARPRPVSLVPTALPDTPKTLGYWIAHVDQVESIWPKEPMLYLRVRLHVEGPPAWRILVVPPKMPWRHDETEIALALRGEDIVAIADKVPIGWREDERQPVLMFAVRNYAELRLERFLDVWLSAWRAALPEAHSFDDPVVPLAILATRAGAAPDVIEQTLRLEVSEKWLLCREYLARWPVSALALYERSSLRDKQALLAAITVLQPHEARRVVKTIVSKSSDQDLFETLMRLVDAVLALDPTWTPPATYAAIRNAYDAQQRHAFLNPLLVQAIDAIRATARTW